MNRNPSGTTSHSAPETANLAPPLDNIANPGTTVPITARVVCPSNLQVVGPPGLGRRVANCQLDGERREIPVRRRIEGEMCEAAIGLWWTRRGAEYIGYDRCVCPLESVVPHACDIELACGVGRVAAHVEGYEVE